MSAVPVRGETWVRRNHRNGGKVAVVMGLKETRWGTMVIAEYENEARWVGHVDVFLEYFYRTDAPSSGDWSALEPAEETK